MLQKNIRDHLHKNYRQYATDADGARYECKGSPKSVADDIAGYARPEARASNSGNEYLRYSDDIVIVGPDGNYPCSIRSEDVNAGYSHGSFVYLGPGFSPGSPAGSSGAARADRTAPNDAALSKEKPMTMTVLAAVEFGAVDVASVTQNVVAAVLYFLVGVAVLGAGFLMVDVLTPGNLRELVFVQHRPNAVAVASAMYAALALVTASAIIASSSQLGQGLVDAAVFGIVGVILQGAALAVLELLVPGRFRDLITAETLHPGAIATAVALLAVGGVNAAALS